MYTHYLQHYPNHPFAYHHIIFINMKNILVLLEQYLRKHPSPTSISAFTNLFKLNYTHSSPYTDAKLSKEVYYPIHHLNQHQLISSLTKKIIYNQKGRIQESDSFDSILTKQKHEKLLQDDVFGKAVPNKDFTRWVYIAEVKQEVAKSYFNTGKGKLPYKHDLGQTYDNIKEVGIFVWDKQYRKIFRVQTSKQLIPSYPSFANDAGSALIFHAYKKQHFGKGLLHCFNRPVSIYRASLAFSQKQADKNKEKTKDTAKQIQLQSKIGLLVSDNEKTNIFPRLSHDYNYLVYLSGTGITHTYYLDLVILKNIDGKWVETHRIKDKFVGYYDTLKTHITTQDGQQYVVCQTIQNGSQKIYKVHLETGVLQNLTEKYENHHFCIQDVLSNGLITGAVTSNCYNTFFYIINQQLHIIPPLAKEPFIEKTYHHPIHTTYIEAAQADILEGFKERAHKRPVVVFAHGGPHGSNVNMLTALRYILLKLGYGLLFPDFSGSIGYGQKFLQNCLGNIGQTDANEIMEVLQKVVKEHGKIDVQNVHIQGGSYGGYMAAIMGSKYSKHFKSAVIMNGVLNIIANLWFSDIPQWSIVQSLQRESLAELNKSHYEEMWRQSPTSDNMKIPTLQFLGAKDRRVPYRQGLLFDAITKEAGTQITTYVYEQSAHALADSVQTSLDVILKTVAFFQGIKQEEVKEKQGKEEELQIVEK